MKRLHTSVIGIALALLLFFIVYQQTASPSAEQIYADAPMGTVMFREGHNTDGRDNGRPVALIAAALGVEDQVFRDAFSNVNPARFGHATGTQTRANKNVLMDALGKHGITNERLDEVSNYYRYRPGRDKVWRSNPAEATAIVEDGKIVRFQVTNHGSGYSSVPIVSVKGIGEVRVKAEIEFSTDLKTNGSIKSLEVVQ